MGASSVTGVGPGSAEGQNKGPGNYRDTYVPLLNPHIILAGTANLTSGTSTVTFPEPLFGPSADFAVFLTSLASTSVYVSGTTNVAGQFTAFTVTGTGSAGFNYSVATVGYGF